MQVFQKIISSPPGIVLLPSVPENKHKSFHV